MAGQDIIVVGASAGGVEALSRLVSDLPDDLPAAVFVVLHMGPYTGTALPRILGRQTKLPVDHPRDGEPIQPNRIYVAVPDHHLIVGPGAVRVTHGPKENGHRPSVDWLHVPALALRIVSDEVWARVLQRLAIKREAYLRGTGGRLAWNEPPPAAITTTLPRKTVPRSVVSRKRPSGSLPSVSTISLKWNVGWKGFTCSRSFSTRSSPLITG